LQCAHRSPEARAPGAGNGDSSRNPERSLLPAVVESITEHLRDDPPSELLQPGQLRYLASRPAEELRGISRTALVQKARFNADRLLAELREYPSPRLLWALAVGASSSAGIAEQEIAFLMDAGEATPGWSRSRATQEFATSAPL